MTYNFSIVEDKIYITTSYIQITTYVEILSQNWINVSNINLPFRDVKPSIFETETLRGMEGITHDIHYPK